jgi:hypothetical protein
MKSATYTRRIKNSREIVGVSTVTFGSKNEATPVYRPRTRLLLWFSYPSIVGFRLPCQPDHLENFLVIRPVGYRRNAQVIALCVSTLVQWI